MQLNSVSAKIGFTGAQNNNKRREKVGDAATATGAAGAGYTATRGAAFKMFKSSANAANAVQLVEEPARQTKSLLNAFKLNFKNFKTDIAEWAKASKMPEFLKPLFTGVLGKFVGGAAAFFVLATGISEVATTTANAIKLGKN